jgi:hypothetical protein
MAEPWPTISRRSVVVLVGAESIFIGIHHANQLTLETSSSLESFEAIDKERLLHDNDPDQLNEYVDDGFHPFESFSSDKQRLRTPGSTLWTLHVLRRISLSSQAK